jgi:hypothetical protein
MLELLMATGSLALHVILALLAFIVFCIILYTVVRVVALAIVTTIEENSKRKREGGTDGKDFIS